MQDVARTCFRDARNQRSDVGDRNFKRTRHREKRRFSALCAAATRDAGWRTGAVILTRLLVTCARLRNDQGVGAGGAERQQRNDDGEAEPPHLIILAFAPSATYVVCACWRGASSR